MSSHRMHVPAPEEINYHEAHEVQRVERALTRIDPGNVLAAIDGRIAAEADPKAHPLHQLVLFYLDRCPAVDGAQLYDDLKGHVLAAIDTCLDELLEMED